MAAPDTIPTWMVWVLLAWSFTTAVQVLGILWLAWRFYTSLADVARRSQVSQVSAMNVMAALRLSENQETMPLASQALNRENATPDPPADWRNGALRHPFDQLDDLVSS